MRDHAGNVSLDRSEVRKISTSPVYLRQHRRAPEEHEHVGVRKSVSVRTVYGSETNLHLYDNTDAFDADFPPDRDARSRKRALARQADPGVYVEDPDGAMTLPVTPDWGSQVYLSVLVPGVDPDALAIAFTQMVEDRFPAHRLAKAQVRWVADRWVEVHRPELPSGGHGGSPGSAGTGVVASVLEAEASSFGRSLRVEQVNPSAPGAAGA